MMFLSREIDIKLCQNVPKRINVRFCIRLNRYSQMRNQSENADIPEASHIHAESEKLRFAPIII